MTFLSISFILHIVTFIIIYQLMKQLRDLKQGNIQEIQTIFESYLQEIKEENNRLQKKINVQPKPKFNSTLKYTDNETSYAKQDSKTNEQTTVKDLLQTSLQSKVLQMHDKGLTIDEIAQKLNCGKTEVALSIKMQQKKK
ncbi:DUF6115 domain-containing protein [Virgibacillus sp. W0430]|uniref:DUF6115 domain-containing protein n=1 Tax=Virgibacillus sp. W0430 TaxID=3391580 RepID=UPI003F461059